MEVGIENIRKAYDLSTEEHDLDGLRLHVVAADHFFAANILFELPEHPELTGKHGAFISFPTREIALIYAVENGDALFDSIKLTEITESIYGDGPGSLSSRLYWWRPTSLVDVTSSQVLVGGKVTRLLSNPELVSLLGSQMEPAR